MVVWIPNSDPHYRSGGGRDGGRPRRLLAVSPNFVGDALPFPAFELIQASIFAPVDQKRLRKTQLGLSIPPMNGPRSDLVSFGDQRVR